MAQLIYKKTAKAPCPRCKDEFTMISTYHFGVTFLAECGGCGFGRSAGDNEEMALIRLHGKYLECKES